mmetsp:Transcript_4017/g.9686  ORF Transcript_4017/g.9686 Transcript_4017/m.9686 type:complete len:222 (+) Transcript_4017:139-804(+)
MGCTHLKQKPPKAYAESNRRDEAQRSLSQTSPSRDAAADAYSHVDSAPDGSATGHVLTYGRGSDQVTVGDSCTFADELDVPEQEDKTEARPERVNVTIQSNYTTSEGRANFMVERGGSDEMQSQAPSVVSLPTVVTMHTLPDEKEVESVNGSECNPSEVSGVYSTRSVGLSQSVPFGSINPRIRSEVGSIATNVRNRSEVGSVQTGSVDAIPEDEQARMEL